MREQDTICAVSTPPGEGGIGIVRVSGRDALVLVSKVFRSKSGKGLEKASSHTIHYGHVIDPATGETVDESMVSVMRAPASYTREDIVEINCHGGMVPLWRTMSLLIEGGARQAEPGEFTKRAFLNGRIDLVQAEAVMDIIRAKTELSHKAANDLLLGGLSAEIGGLRERLISLIASVEAGIDFPEEDIDTGAGPTPAEDARRLLDGMDSVLASCTYGRIIRDGFAAAIVGRPNVGKSSLLNALLKQNRAIVTEVPGTTRDVLEEYLNISGVPIKVLDTAGIRHAHDVVEQEGVRRSLEAIRSADIVLVILDGSMVLTPEDRRVLDETRGRNAVAVINKSDLPRKLEPLEWPEVQISLSCKSGEGIDDLRKAVAEPVMKGAAGQREHPWAVNRRHRTALEQARGGLEKALESIEADLSPEFIALDLREALDHLGLIIGATYTDDILDRIFNDFCIGK
ncbi:MAG TPA: tRNA uridine-5-carboxymethylaminomethyl(34) synthesis GTPase MnmE [Nitrospirota bacterium]